MEKANFNCNVKISLISNYKSAQLMFTEKCSGDLINNRQLLLRRYTRQGIW